MSTGIICEYNPFHNGHAYHIRKIKEMYPDDTIILVMSSNFLQRGETSLINKWDKTEIALNCGVDYDFAQFVLEKNLISMGESLEEYIFSFL